MIPPVGEAATPDLAEIEPGQLSCYTAALARYLEGHCPDPLDRVARSVRLAVRPGLPDGLIPFSHHWLALNELADGSRLVYRGVADAAALPAGLDAEMRTGREVLAVTYTGSMAWSLADSEASAPHFLLVRERRGQRWHVDDPFQALLPSGNQEPFTGWLTTAELIEAMSPPSPMRPELRLRKEYVFGFPVPLPPDDHYQWLGRAPVNTAPDSNTVLASGWLAEPAQALRFLRDLWAAPDHQVTGRERLFDDMWAAARHHAFRYAHLCQLPLDSRGVQGGRPSWLAPPEQELVRKAHDLWHDLPMALHFAIASAARGRRRPTLIKMTFDQLIEAEAQVAGLLHAHGYGPPATASPTYHPSQ